MVGAAVHDYFCMAAAKKYGNRHSNPSRRPPTGQVRCTSFTPAGIVQCVIFPPCALTAGTAGGVTLTMATIFLLGILATKAEPALNVLGETVETLSGGKFTKRLLIWAVCVGVAVGMCAGGLCCCT